MKSTGIVRKVDKLGRIVLPKELRRTLNINESDSLGIYVDGETVILNKHQPNCVFCSNSNAEKLTYFSQKLICAKCKSSLAKQ